MYSISWIHCLILIIDIRSILIKNFLIHIMRSSRLRWAKRNELLFYLELVYLNLTLKICVNLITLHFS